MSDSFEPVILGFLCNWCAYAGGDLAGVSRLQYPPNMRVIRTMCSGMVHPRLVVDALDRGLDGVIVMG
jgi:F420-non-reducing hydrogenase iron-sulfur subunit